MRWLLAIVATLACAPSAYAQGATIQAGDADVTWTPPNVTVKAGETVNWTWTGTHNVQSVSGSWTIDDYESPAQQTFASAGEFGFKCIFHPGMEGKVTVTDATGAPPPPPPPPPPSEQWWQNDQRAPTVVELARDLPPRLSRVRAAALPDGARVRFRLSERARVVVRFKLGGLAVKTASRTFRAGSHNLTVRDRRLSGRYRIDIFARDAAGQRSIVRHDRVTIR